MPIQVLQRAVWDGEPIKQGETFRLKKDEKAAVCELWSHRFGWELRLIAAGELLNSHVCRSQDEVFSTFEMWRAAMVDKGWQ